VEGKVRLPEPEKRRKTERKEKPKTFREFADENQIAQRFDFTSAGTEIIAGQRARRIAFAPNHRLRARTSAARFMDAISGTGWIAEGTNRLVKFDMRLERPHQLFWIIAVLRELEIRYELLQPDEILGRSNLQVAFTLVTPVSSIRQQHEVQLDHFRRRSDAPPASALAAR
jgi:hypothetical protein